MLIPETVLQGRYRIIRQLGQGGMGTVYEAIDQRLDSTVALKETFFGDERLRKQFEREARLLARMHHPALPRVSDHFSEGEGQFLVMQFIPGDDLAEMLARRRTAFSAAEALRWADQLLDALDYLHTQDPQIIHRDIKPQNLKLTARGQIILLDFGLAKGQASEISRITTSASIFGYTPNYAPLEQIQGLGTDARSDIYALAATLYHLLTGAKPPDALTRAAALVNGQPDPLRRAHEVNTALSPSLSTVLDRAMAQNRDQRYTSAAEMRQELDQAGAGTTVTGRSEANTVLFPPAGPTVSGNTKPIVNQATQQSGETTIVAKPTKRRGAVWAIAAAAVVILVAGLGGLYAYQQRKNAASVAPTNAEATPSDPVPVQKPNGSETSTAADQSLEKKVEVDKQQVAADEKLLKKQEKTTKQKPAKQRTNNEDSTDAAAFDGDNPPVTPVRPNVPDANVPEPRIGRPRGVRRYGGVTIRNLPNGDQVITDADGTRVLVKPDGRNEIFRPRQRVFRRRLAPRQ